MTNFVLLKGAASPTATVRFARDATQKGIEPSHFRLFEGRTLSSTGVGTYLGGMSRSVDEQMENAIFDSVMSGASNVIDTAINYRAMKSEKSIGRALVRLAEAGISRPIIHLNKKWLHHK